MPHHRRWARRADVLSKTRHMSSVEVVSTRTASPLLLTNISLTTVESICMIGCATGSSAASWDAGSATRKPIASRT